jgi:hypothetical protein
MFLACIGYIALARADRDGGSSRIPAIFGLVGAINIQSSTGP